MCLVSQWLARVPVSLVCSSPTPPRSSKLSRLPHSDLWAGEPGGREYFFCSWRSLFSIQQSASPGAFHGKLACANAQPRLSPAFLAYFSESATVRQLSRYLSSVMARLIFLAYGCVAEKLAWGAPNVVVNAAPDQPVKEEDRVLESASDDQQHNVSRERRPGRGARKLLSVETCAVRSNRLRPRSKRRVHLASAVQMWWHGQCPAIRSPLHHQQPRERLLYDAGLYLDGGHSELSQDRSRGNTYTVTQGEMPSIAREMYFGATMQTRPLRKSVLSLSRSLRGLLRQVSSENRHLCCFTEEPDPYHTPVYYPYHTVPFMRTLSADERTLSKTIMLAVANAPGSVEFVCKGEGSALAPHDQRVSGYSGSSCDTDSQDSPTALPGPTIQTERPKASAHLPCPGYLRRTRNSAAGATTRTRRWQKTRHRSRALS